MVNTARVMGLNLDPDEFPGIYSLFEAEARRRVWWDVFYYDLYVYHVQPSRGSRVANSRPLGLYPTVWAMNR